jgi:hypothetical protein
VKAISEVKPMHRTTNKPAAKKRTKRAPKKTG